MDAACPCGRGQPYERCCGPLHRGGAALTAEQVMRARYSAFARGDIAYLLASWDPATRPARLRLEPGRRWTGLEVQATTGGGALDATGTVTFAATSEQAGRVELLHEVSAFARRDGRWCYVGPTRAGRP